MRRLEVTEYHDTNSGRHKAHRSYRTTMIVIEHISSYHAVARGTHIRMTNGDQINTEMPMSVFSNKIGDI